MNIMLSSSCFYCRNLNFYGIKAFCLHFKWGRVFMHNSHIRFELKLSFSLKFVFGVFAIYICSNWKLLLLLKLFANRFSQRNKNAVQFNLKVRVITMELLHIVTHVCIIENFERQYNEKVWFYLNLNLFMLKVTSIVLYPVRQHHVLASSFLQVRGEESMNA